MKQDLCSFSSYVNNLLYVKHQIFGLLSFMYSHAITFLIWSTPNKPRICSFFCKIIYFPFPILLNDLVLIQLFCLTLKETFNLSSVYTYCMPCIMLFINFCNPNSCYCKTWVVKVAKKRWVIVITFLGQFDKSDYFNCILQLITP